MFDLIVDWNETAINPDFPLGIFRLPNGKPGAEYLLADRDYASEAIVRAGTNSRHNGDDSAT